MDAETRYSKIEKLCLRLYFSCTKLRHYLLSNECIIVCKADVVKYILSAPVLKGRLGKWMLALSEFDLRFESAEAVKARVLSDLIVEHGGQNEGRIEPVPWLLFFDGSICRHGCGIGIVIVSPPSKNF